MFHPTTPCALAMAFSEVKWPPMWKATVKQGAVAVSATGSMATISLPSGASRASATMISRNCSRLVKRRLKSCSRASP
jgi:hypothetical protein